MQCPRCGSENREGRSFCGGCGAALGVPAAWRCPACRYENAAAERFCGGCGAAAPAATAPTATAPTGAVAAETLAGERRQVAILFADLSGFSELSKRLDAEDLRRVIESFYARADAAIAAFGGTVDKHIGDAVMALFGAPVAHGDDALRAARAALAIHASLAGLADPAGQPLTAHIGVANGEVVAGGIGERYTVLGDAVNLAARLVALAGPGETVISDELARGLGGRILATALPPTAVKGFAEPVRAWRLERLEASRGPTAPYVGREAERAMLGGLIEACRTAGRVVLLRGEAGMGKSRLLEETERMAEARGFAAHKTQVLDFGTGRGEGALASLAASLLGIPLGGAGPEVRAAAARAEAAGLIAPDARFLLHRLLDLGDDAEGEALYGAMDNETRKQRRRGLVAGLIDGLGRRQPQLVAVEDIHWADADLVEDLAAIAAVTAQAPVLLVMTTRPERDPIDGAWRAKLQGAAVSAIDLAPLGRDDSQTLARGMLGDDDPRIAACIDRAGGNPFFLEQLLHHAGTAASAAVPASVQSLVHGRVDRLTPAQKQALQAASVLGQRFGLDPLRQLAGEAAGECAALVELHLLRPDDAGFAFIHALVRDAVYGSLLKTRRRELHRTAAAWFAAHDPLLRARHLDLAEDPGAAAAYLAAAEAQAASYRPEDALALAVRGLALEGGDAAPRAALASLAGELLQGLGRTEEAVAAFRTAADLAAAGAPRLRAWIGLVNGLSVQDRLDEALALLDRAEAEAAAASLLTEEARLHGLRGNILFPRGELERCLAEHSRALELATRAGAVEEEVRAHGGLGDAYYVRGDYGTCFEHFDRCVQLAHENGFRRIEVANRPMRAVGTLYRAAFQDALAELQAAIDLARQVGQRRAEMVAEHFRFFGFLETADLTGARRSAERSFAISRQLQARRFDAEGLMMVGTARAMAGDRDGVEDLREAVTIARETPRFLLPSTLGTLAAATGDPGERKAALAEGERLIAAGTVSHNRIWFNRFAIEAALAEGDAGAADRYAAALERASNQPLPYLDFLAARGRLLAGRLRGVREPAAVKGLVEAAKRYEWLLVLPGLEALLAET